MSLMPGRPVATLEVLQAEPPSEVENAAKEVEWPPPTSAQVVLLVHETAVARTRPGRSVAGYVTVPGDQVDPPSEVAIETSPVPGTLVPTATQAVVEVQSMPSRRFHLTPLGPASVDHVWPPSVDFAMVRMAPEWDPPTA